MCKRYYHWHKLSYTMNFYTHLQLIVVIVTGSISLSISISKHCGEKQRIKKPPPPIYIDFRIYPCLCGMPCGVECHFFHQNICDFPHLKLFFQTKFF